VEPSLLPPVPANKDPRKGQRLRYASLAPRFDETQHGLYRDLVERALQHPETRNLALTGAYGAGKSSVLRAVRKAHGTSVVELSLSTILAGGGEPPEQNGNPAASTASNRIQKEIVKQLLYRMPPSRTPRSRFRRASKAHLPRDILFAAMWGGAAFAAFLTLGLVTKLVDLLDVHGAQERASYALLGILCAAVVLAVRRTLQGKVVVDSLSAGPATVSLAPSSTSYFDQYLDEIVYFFEVSRCDVVIIEDIDRFEDAHVFDTLRALNGLLNSSRQLNRRIVFIYAIRDSVFEKIATEDDDDDAVPEKTAESDKADASEPADNQAHNALTPANRTKFFDVIIPVVPFITHDNARDLMSKAMASPDFTISPKLIRLAARHVADMRLIHNVRNEFEVYRDRLMISGRAVPGLTVDRLFAIVLFKNAHMADFEAVRVQASSLDDLFALWRRLVQENLQTQTRQLAVSRRKLTSETTAETRARELGRKLLAHRTAMTTALRPAYGGAQTTVTLTLDGATVDDDTVRSRRFWSDLAGGASLAWSLSSGYTDVALRTDAGQLATMLQIRLDPAEWGSVDSSAVAAEIQVAEERLRFLRHHTWRQLWSRPEFKLNVAEEGEVADPKSFRELARDALNSPLARDLVEQGFLTHNFALYVSSFYGTHLGADAMEYIVRYVEPGEPEATWPLSETDVEQILTDRGTDLLEDPSVYNVAILDYLLARRPSDAAVTVRRLATRGEQERAFIDVYAEQGANQDLLFAQLAPYWSEVLHYVAADSHVADDRRAGWLGAALSRCVSTVNYETSASVRAILESGFAKMPAITDPPSAERAAAAFRILAASGAVLPSVGPLNALARAAVRQSKAYEVNEPNLAALTPGDSIALDVLAAAVPEVYEHAIEHLDDYVAAVESSSSTPHTVEDAEQFQSVLVDVARRHGERSVRAVVTAASDNCRVPQLRQVPSVAWPALLDTVRAPCTFENAQAYLKEVGEVDEHLASWLETYGTVTWSEGDPLPDRRELAVQIVNARRTLPKAARRVEIAASLQPGELDGTVLTPESGDLVALLLREGLLADDESAFTDRLTPDWQTREAAIAASSNFPEFATPGVLPVAAFASFLRSGKIPSPVKVAVANNLPTFLEQASRSQAQAITDALNAGAWRIGGGRIRALSEAGVESATLVPLIEREGERLPIDELRGLLRTMGGRYAQIADHGTKRPTFPDDVGHRWILQQLRSAGIVSSFGRDARQGGDLRVRLHHGKR
jgi:hypothetical protein